MELFTSQLYENLLKREWWRGGYKRLHGKTRKKLRVLRLGGKIRRVLWRVRSVPKLRRRVLGWPIKMLVLMRDAYVNAMLGLECRLSAPPRQKCTVQEFESRLILEIRRSVAASSSLHCS